MKVRIDIGLKTNDNVASKFQVVVIFSVLSLFLYFIVYAFSLPETGQGPDYSWLKVKRKTTIPNPDQ